MERGDDDVSARLGEIGARRGDGEVETAVAKQLGEPSGAADAIGGDDDAVLLGDHLGEPLGKSLAVADHRTPARGLHHRRIGLLRRRARASTSIARCPTADRCRCASGGTCGRRRVPRSTPASGPGRLLRRAGRWLGRACAVARRGRPFPCRQQVGDQRVAVDEPRQPALHAIEHGTLGKALPLLATPRLFGHQFGGTRPDGVARQQLAGGKDAHLGEVIGAALIVDRELGEAIDLVAPQVDADRRVGGRWEDVDDGAAPGHLAAVLDEILAAVAEADQRVEQCVGIDDIVRMHDDRLDLDRFRAQPLQQGAHAGHDDSSGRFAGGVLAQPPQHLHPLAHRLDARADAFERKRLPRREQHDRIGRHELAQVVVQLTGVGAGGRRHQQRLAIAELGERGDRDGPRPIPARRRVPPGCRRPASDRCRREAGGEEKRATSGCSG